MKLPNLQGLVLGTNVLLAFILLAFKTALHQYMLANCYMITCCTANRFRFVFPGNRRLQKAPAGGAVNINCAVNSQQKKMSCSFYFSFSPCKQLSRWFIIPPWNYSWVYFTLHKNNEILSLSVFEDVHYIVT